MLGQAEVLAVVDRDLHEGRPIDVERPAQRRQQVRRRRRPEPGDPERAGIVDEVGVAELDADKRARFAQFADQLIAGGAGFPTASEADPEGKWLDRTLVARPDLIEVVPSCI